MGSITNVSPSGKQMGSRRPIRSSICSLKTASLRTIAATLDHVAPRLLFRQTNPGSRPPLGEYLQDIREAQARKHKIRDPEDRLFDTGDLKS